jgi:hypothetical protein
MAEYDVDKIFGQLNQPPAEPEQPAIARPGQPAPRPAAVPGGMPDLTRSVSSVPKTPTPAATDSMNALLRTPPRVAYALPGIFGSAEQTAIDAYSGLIRNPYYWAKEKLDLISPNERKRLSAEPVFSKNLPTQGRDMYLAAMEKLGRITPQQRAEREAVPIWENPSKRSEFFGSPTMAGRSEEFRENFDASGVGGINWGKRPETPEGRISEMALEGAMQGIPGSKGVIGRMVTGGLGAGAGKWAEEKFPDSAVAPIVMNLLGNAAGGLGSAVAGKVVGDTVGGLVLPSYGLKRDLQDAIRQDLVADPQTAEALRKAVAAGLPVTMADLVTGPNAAKLIERGAYGTPANIAKQKSLTDFLIARQAEGAARTSDFLKSEFGTHGEYMGLPKDATGQLNPDLNVAIEKRLVEAANKVETTRLYDAMRSNPAAGSISTSVFDTVRPDFLENPLLKDAMAKASVSGQSDPSRGIIAPRFIRGPYGTQEVPGNLAFWDQVKRELDRTAKLGEAVPDAKAAEATITGAKNAKAELVGVLDKVVPEYEIARDRASEVFGAASAPEAGELFLKTTNDFKVEQIANAMKNYSPEQRELFAVGYARGLLKRVNSGDVKGLYTTLTKPETRDRTIAAIGEDRYNSILGRVAQERLLAETPTVGLPKTARADARAAGITASLTGGATYGLTTLAGGVPFTTDIGPLAVTAAFAGAGAALSGLKSVAEHRIGERLIRLVTDTKNPKAAKELGNLLNSQPSVMRIFNKMTLSANQAAQQARRQFVTRPAEEDDRQPREPAKPQTPADKMSEATRRLMQDVGMGGPQAQASGGRVGYRSGGRILDHGSKADALVRAAEAARKTISGTTEPLLDLPDEHVVKALAVAGEAI